MYVPSRFLLHPVAPCRAPSPPCALPGPLNSWVPLPCTESLSPLPRDSRPRTGGQLSVTPTMAAWSPRGRKMGVVLLDRGKPCRVDWPPQSGWQVAVSPLPTSPLTYVAPLHLSTCTSCSTFLEANPRPPFHRPHSQLPPLSHLHADAQNGRCPVAFPSVSPSTPHPHARPEGQGPLGGVAKGTLQDG